MKLLLDTRDVTFTCTRAPMQRVTFETGQPKIDKATGLPLWVVQVMALDQSGGDIISVAVPGEPKVSLGCPVSITGLVAVPWSQESRSGVAYRADSIEQTSAAEHAAAKSPVTRG